MQLAYSIWPNQTLDIPRVLAWPVKLKGGCVLFRTLNKAEGSGLGRWVDLPKELYLRELMDLDPRNDDALLSFVGAYGPLGDVWWPACDLSAALGADLGDEYRELDMAVPMTHRLSPDEDWGEIHVNFFAQSLDSIRTHAISLRDGVRLWHLQTAQLSLEELAEKWELGQVGCSPPKDLNEALVVLAQIINAGLESFRTGVRLVRRDWNERLVRHSTRMNVYSAMCLQFLNSIVRETTYLKAVARDAIICSYDSAGAKPCEAQDWQPTFLLGGARADNARRSALLIPLVRGQEPSAAHGFDRGYPRRRVKS
jgi:hypothetical protein